MTSSSLLLRPYNSFTVFTPSPFEFHSEQRFISVLEKRNHPPLLPQALHAPLDMYTYPRASDYHDVDMTYPTPYDDVSPTSASASLLPLPTPAALLTHHFHHQQQQQLAEMELSSLNMAGAAHSSSTSGCSGYDSPSDHHHQQQQQQRPSSLIQRSISSHSLQKNGVHRFLSANDYLDMDTSSPAVRRVLSTGDLNRMKMGHYGQRPSAGAGSPLGSESNASIIIEGMNRACPYSPEEKKERIERYRSKRTLRNFNKRIKYACRKTLADSRPRIRGRFARNDEIDQKNPEEPDQWNHDNVAGYGDQDSYSYDEDDDNWINYLDSVSSIIG